MPPPKKQLCHVCNNAESKYTCSKCMVLYCSVPCYKRHQDLQEGSCSLQGDPKASSSITQLESARQQAELTNEGSAVPEPRSTSGDVNGGPSSDTLEEEVDPLLRPLTSLTWPYIPEESAYPDPLKRDDPKMLQLHQYEAIAMSATIRSVLVSNPRLPSLLRTIDKLRGESREDALQRALGISASSSSPDNNTTSPNPRWRGRGRGGPSRHRNYRARNGGNDNRGDGDNDEDGEDELGVEEMTEEDKLALRELAQAVESAVRGGKEDALGLDWGDQ